MHTNKKLNLFYFRSIIIIIMLASLLLIVACTTNSTASQNPVITQDTPNLPSQNTTAQVPLKPLSSQESSSNIQSTISQRDNPLKEFNLTVKQWEFTPSTIRVRLGDTVRITATSQDVTHSFNLPEFGVNEKIEPNKQTTFQFVASKKGTYHFFCSIPCGSGHSTMEGTIIVE